MGGQEAAKGFKTWKGKVIHLALCFRQLSTFPRGPPRSIIDSTELNFRVRNGNGCVLRDMATETCYPEGLARIRQILWLSQSVISTSQLNALLHLHLSPINVVVFYQPDGEVLSSD